MLNSAYFSIERPPQVIDLAFCDITYMLYRSTSRDISISRRGVYKKKVQDALDVWEDYAMRIGPDGITQGDA